MYAKQKAIGEVLTSLKKAIGKQFTVSADMLETPKDPKMGDVAFPCFELAKGAHRNPVEIATELAAKIGPSALIETIESKGPYVNFSYKKYVYAEAVLEDVLREKEAYGASESGAGKHVLVEYAQPNTHKEFHVGHIRNAVLGQSVLNVLTANGYETVGAAYIGDIGAHVAKALWGLKKFHDGETFAKEERAKKLGEIYAEATRYAEEHEEAKAEIADVHRKLEAEEEPWHSLWKETREWSLAEFRVIFSDLNVKPDVWYYESEVEEDGKELVKKLLTNGIAKKSEGATVVDLEEEGLGIFLILKSDGSSLYATKDLALAYRKQQAFDPDRQIFVVDVRQSLYFKQLFATLRKMGFTETLVHLAYDMVMLPEGTISSRTGNIVSERELRAEMVAELTKQTAQRHEDWSEKQIKKTAEILARASIIFMMLRQDPNSIITFDMKEAMSVDGFTGPYILYSIARIESIKKKTKVKVKANASLLSHEAEFALLTALGEYPAVVQRAGQTFQVSAIAQWAFDLAKLFAEYYHEVHVIDPEDKKATAARLALLEAVRQGLQNAMTLLGIDVLKEM